MGDIINYSDVWFTRTNKNNDEIVHWGGGNLNLIPDNIDCVDLESNHLSPYINRLPDYDIPLNNNYHTEVYPKEKQCLTF